MRMENNKKGIAAYGIWKCMRTSSMWTNHMEATGISTPSTWDLWTCSIWRIAYEYVAQWQMNHWCLGTIGHGQLFDVARSAAARSAAATLAAARSTAEMLPKWCFCNHKVLLRFAKLSDFKIVTFSQRMQLSYCLLWYYVFIFRVCKFSNPRNLKALAGTHMRLHEAMGNHRNQQEFSTGT